MEFKELMQCAKNAAESFAGDDILASEYITRYQAAFLVGYSYSPNSSNPDIQKLSLETVKRNITSKVKRNGDQRWIIIASLAWQKGQDLRQLHDKALASV
jgi:hypothetical protein